MSNNENFIIIPKNILNNNQLKAGAKLLYGNIYSLCLKKGYCWANNEYFAKEHNISARAVQNYIADLTKFGYISTKISGNKRYIELTQQQDNNDDDLPF
ncbi:helix-turn-helix domain-containing protein [uncultured Eubacterium sp.]|uniref:helix-turn-helix domain-containing protein n=1 Tax=uncultured Eubacterium sp. TaxID=165185 RepID=UPI002804F529|nr:helix-turn-helix domain-containing protein [uncultured Eubacterium sp.]